MKRKIKKPELTIPVNYGYYTKKELFAYVTFDPNIWVSGYSIAEIKKKLKIVMHTLELPYKLIYKWKLI